ncbi:MAG: hypothetical protein PHD76_06230 [Methylacidiphilales bacterium]|nr:hypothetical protein [Candidatus Methylacidiphilales bacterium]
MKTISAYLVAFSLLAGSGLLISGCGTVSTHDMELQNLPVPEKRPTSIFIRDFETDGVVLTMDMEQAAAADFESGVVHELGDRLKERLAQEGFDVQRQDKTQPFAADGWLVSGRIRLLSMADAQSILLNPDSARQNRIECTVFVYDLGKSQVQPFMTFRVTGRRKIAEDTAADTAPPADISLKDECRETGELITQTLLNYLKEHALGPFR